MVLTGCRAALYSSDRLMRDCLSHRFRVAYQDTMSDDDIRERVHTYSTYNANASVTSFIVLIRNRDPEFQGVSWEEWMQTMAFLTLEHSRQLHMALTGFKA